MFPLPLLRVSTRACEQLHNNNDSFCSCERCHNCSSYKIDNTHQTTVERNTTHLIFNNIFFREMFSSTKRKKELSRRKNDNVKLLRQLLLASITEPAKTVKKGLNWFTECVIQLVFRTGAGQFSSRTMHLSNFSHSDSFPGQPIPYFTRIKSFKP